MVAVESPKRIYSLDVLRGAAVLLVLFCHMPTEGLTGAGLFLQTIGWSGVDLFFVLSGFLISGLLFNELDKTGTLELKRFWLRRGFKIWPSYYFTYMGAMILRAAYEIHTGNTANTYSRFRAKIPSYVFVQNYFPVEARWNHSWSVAIEEHFYLALPLLLLLVNRKRLIPYGAAVSVIVLALRLARFYSGDADWQDFYYPTHLRVDALCFGVMLCYVFRYHQETFRRLVSPWLLILLPLVSLAYFYPLETSGFAVTWEFTILYLVYGGMVALARAYPHFGEKWPWRGVAHLGVYSYTIYLAHSVINTIPGYGWLRESVGKGWPDRVLFFAASILLGVVISHAVERPFLGLRARLFRTSDR